MSSPIKASLLRVARSKECNTQQATQFHATANATTTQQPTQKPASLLDLARNKLCNNHATSSKKTVQQAPPFLSELVACDDGQIDEVQVARHQRVLSMLETDPDKRYSLLADDVTTDPVIVTIYP